jgi:hypothetical protein
MSRTSSWTRLGRSFVALGLVTGAAASAQADPILPTSPITTPTTPDLSSTVLGYDTAQSSIGTTGVTGDPSGLKISSVAGGTFLTPSYLSLGAFQTSALPAGQTTTYTNTPFHIMFAADSINGQTGITPNGAASSAPIDLGGVLNGTLTGGNNSQLTATFGKFVNGVFTPYTSTDSFKFNTGLYANTLTLPTNPVPIVPSTTNGGVTTLQAFLTSTPVGSPVPEPSTVVLFAATVAGLGFRHRLRKARAALR